MLDYDQPIDRAEPATRSAPKPLAGLSVAELSRLVWRRKAMIASAGLICACLAVVIGKNLPPRYTATAQLYVDPRELQLVDRELTPRAQDVSGMAMVVESQARLITSNGVLLQVIRENNLDKDPEFGGVGGGGAKGLLSSLFGGEPRPADEDKAAQTAALEALNKHITIRKTERSFIVDVEVWSQDPARAAMLANTLAKAYLAESRNSQATAARRATTDLSSRLKELRDRLRNAETALATYKAQNNFVGTQDTLISDQQLSASNQRLAAARAATLDAQAKYDQIEASRRAATDAGAIPEALQSPTIANLRSQYADARKRYAELAAELGPRHPSLRQTEKQVEDLRRTINEEIDRFAQAARNDLTRARDYEASLNKALETQKRYSVQLSQASVRLRELEREVDASRDVYQAFLKRSRETEEQESLNTSAARIIGEATIPQRRTFPPGMSLLAMLGLLLGALAAAGWVIAADRLSFDATEPEPSRRGRAAMMPTQATAAPPQQAPLALIEKPLIARLQETDVIRTLGAILAIDDTIDLTRLGWPTLRPGFPLTTLLNALRDMRTAVVKRSPGHPVPVIAIVGAGNGEERTVAALNVALAAARDGARILIIDADHSAQLLSNRIDKPNSDEPSRFGWLSLGNKGPGEIKTANEISILPAATAEAGKAADTMIKAIAQVRSAGGYDFIILDGPAMPVSDADRKLLDGADGLIAVLPTSLDINDSMEDIITALGGAERKLVGVILNELTPASEPLPQGKQYA
ncbi:MAG: hypothetical protein HY852_19870 [Bradyrhizobium sp.]|uniref:exopolysaccharide transport family protein n=1 Tax=Bradyrhizobium sp. TaxID=376 RepID=UPI0025B7FE7C|nr:exopolysaccharide transport family protein [Bradyrhizobium sp.]MBI5264064.1 hypothetical protein [Bradyrhizobium sp.]